MRSISAFLTVALLWPAVSGAQDSSDSRLAAVRARIASLESHLGDLQRESADTLEDRQRLDTELALAEARVRELEIVLGNSRDEIVEIRDQVTMLADQLQRRREVLQRHLEMITLLGRPGPLQLFYDAARGGELEQAVGTVAVMTAAQLRLIEEYEQIQNQRTRQLAALSRRLETARLEAEELGVRRQELESVRLKVEDRLRELERQQRRAGNRLAEMRSRAEALERLMGIVRSRQSFAGKEDIRRFRGALPWPAEGEIVLTFGKHYVPKYSTYTVCNGLRLKTDGGVPVNAVFPGEVAYAGHFKGYGNMVVVDHGNGVYSLVAGLATIHVRVNQRVTMGKRLGLTPPTVEESNLYVEIRVGEKPQDPRRWLQLEEE